MKRILLAFILTAPLLSTSGCALTKSLETYNSKECEELRKIAQENFLSGGADLSLRPADNNDIAEELIPERHSPADIDQQALRLSYKGRCQ